MGTTRRELAKVRAAFSEAGMSLKTYAGILSKFAKGYREVVASDTAQAVRCQSLQESGKSKLAFRYAPKTVKMTDEHTGLERDVIVVDEKTQMTAVALIADILGYKESTGVRVNVNAGAQAIAGKDTTHREAEQLGDLVVLVDAAADDEIKSAVADLPPPVRRKLLSSLLKIGREKLHNAELTIAPGRVPADNAKVS